MRIGDSICKGEIKHFTLNARLAQWLSGRVITACNSELVMSFRNGRIRIGDSIYKRKNKAFNTECMVGTVAQW